MRLLDAGMLLELFRLVEGAPAPVRDLGALDSAVYRQHAAMYGFDLYPTLDLKVAALMDGIARSHPLIDGNKRLAAIAARATFDMNGRRDVVGDTDDWEAFILRLSNEHMDVEDIAAYLAVMFPAT